MAIDTQAVVAWLNAVQQVFAENRQYLTDLDAAIGDADHGSNLDRGFTAVRDALSNAPPGDIAAALQTAATVLIRTVGGASGPLYGTFFLRAAAACAGKSKLDSPGLASLFAAAVEGVRHRGKAAAGDKTMLDALLPALAAIEQARDAGAEAASVMLAGASAAEAGMRDTVPMLARKGRASYLGERSIGHQDPGATSSYLMLRAAAETWRTQS